MKIAETFQEIFGINIPNYENPVLLLWIIIVLLIFISIVLIAIYGKIKK